jgi:hypothetical protein
MIQNWATASPVQHVCPVFDTSWQKVEAAHMRESGTHAMPHMTRDAAKIAQHHAATAVPTANEEHMHHSSMFAHGRPASKPPEKLEKPHEAVRLWVQ